MGKKTEKKGQEPVEIECTINLGKKLVKVYGAWAARSSFDSVPAGNSAQKKRAPRATREIKHFARQQLGTQCVVVALRVCFAAHASPLAGMCALTLA